MLRFILRRLAGLPSLRRSPTIVERAMVHLLYLTGFFLLVWIALGYAGLRSSTSIGTLVTAAGVLAATPVAFLYWSVQERRVATESWFLSHLLWLAGSFTPIFVVAAVGGLVIALILLFSALFPSLVAVAIYGLLITGGALGLWIGYRMVRGYAAFTRGQPVGSYAQLRGHDSSEIVS